MSAYQEMTSGVVLAGEGDTLYFIAREKLADYELTAEAAALVRAWAAREPDTRGYIGTEQLSFPGILIVGPVLPMALPMQALRFRRGLAEATPIPIP